MLNTIRRAQAYAKSIVAAVGSIVTAASTLIPADWQPYITFGLAILTAFATYQIPNVPADEDGPKHVAE